jgi:hypothetical protein
MNIGFTGTREGTSRVQFAALLDLLRKIKGHTAIESVLHGCCVGADADFVMAVKWLLLNCRIEAFPSNISAMTDADALVNSDVVHPTNEPLVRNKSIVERCDLLIACPNGEEVTRSGTWSTVRLARAQAKMVRIIMPDGTIVREGKA